MEETVHQTRGSKLSKAPQGALGSEASHGLCCSVFICLPFSSLSFVFKRSQSLVTEFWSSCFYVFLPFF